MIEARGLTKRYGPTLAVDALSFDVRPGVVTGFLGPNGSGKSTTMRMILGLDRPDAGQVRIGGRRYRELRWPLREVGALLEARAFHPGRQRPRPPGRAGRQQRDPARPGSTRCSTWSAWTAWRGRRAGTFSLGMAQRLGIAAALLGDPGVLLLDEPVNGLDPEGIRWIRDLLRSLAAEGRTVFVSSHLISEMALTADRLVVIGRGGCWPTRRSPSCRPGSASLEEAFFELTARQRRVPGGQRLGYRRSARHDRHRETARPPGRYRFRAGGPDGMDQAAQPALHLVDPGDHRRRRRRHRGRRGPEHQERRPRT